MTHFFVNLETLIHFELNLYLRTVISKSWKMSVYLEVLRQLQHLTNTFISHSIMIDFGQCMIATLNQEYPLVSQKVYIFCLSKSINWHVQELGLSIAASFSKVSLEFYFYLMFQFWMKIFPIQVIGFYMLLF